MTFASKIFKKIESFDNKIAISFKGEKIYYKDLNDISKRISTLFKNNNIDSNVVGILGQRNFSVYYGILGAIYSGCTYVPINDKYSEKRILKIIKEANVSVVIGNKKSIYLARNALNSAQIKIIILPEEERSLNQEENFISNDIKVFYKSDLKKLNLGFPKKVNSDNIFYILFTSGSTGTPKGVQVTDSNIDEFIKNNSLFYNLPIGYRASQTFDLGFDPSVVDMFFTWINGGELCLLDQSELVMPYEYIKREKINYWYSVPTLANFMFKMGYLKPNSFPDLQYSAFAGEPISKELCDAWQIAAPNSAIENFYGPTEATVTITRFLYKKEYKNRNFTNSRLPIGNIYSGHSFEIIDQNDNRLTNGEKGQLIISGNQITKGYINDKEKTDKAFKKFSWDKTNQKWYATGDIAFVNNFGEIEYVGRIDNQIKIAGKRVEIGEIETALLQSKIIRDIVILPKKDINGTVKYLVGFTTTKISEKDKYLINQAALKYIEKLFLPRKLFFIEKLPLTNSGKTDINKLIEIINKNKL